MIAKQQNRLSLPQNIFNEHEYTLTDSFLRKQIIHFPDGTSQINIFYIGGCAYNV